MPAGTDLTYTWTQALSDLGEVSPIVALTGFFLLAVVTDLVLPRPRRGGAVAMVAVVGFAYSLGTAAYRWANGSGPTPITGLRRVTSSPCSSRFCSPASASSPSRSRTHIFDAAACSRASSTS